jgi:hypothetical protein
LGKPPLQSFDPLLAHCFNDTAQRRLKLRVAQNLVGTRHEP